MMSGEEIDALIISGGVLRLGMGSRRACYALPGGELCVKCYRSDEEIAEGRHPNRPPFKPLVATVVKEIANNRFDKKRNTCCLEYRYWDELKRRLPGSLMSVFPATMELVLLPSRGWCIVEELVRNFDGSHVAKFHEELMSVNAMMRAQLLEAFNDLEHELLRHAVRMYDPQNILVQKNADGSIRLRITDFEPVSRALIPLDHLSSSIVRMKVKRRFKRYRKLLYINEVENCRQKHCICRKA